MEMGEVEWFLDRTEGKGALERIVALDVPRADPVEPRLPRETPRSPSGSTAPRLPERPSAPPDATAAKRPVEKELPVLPSDHDALRDVALGCTRCGLSESRTQVVFSDGAPDARLMVVGEAPGANEDETGLPFVGAAGKFLDLLLATVGLSREESVYICNVLKCRPPGNRNPEPGEIVACSPYLLKQIEIVAPDAILAVGSFAAQLLTGREKSALGKLRGEVHSYQGVPLVVTYHPAALLRNGNWTRAFWSDLQLLRDVIDRGR
jgi:DNA polymerase